MPKKSPVEDLKVEAILTMMELNKELTNAAVATLSSATHLYDLRAALSRFELRHLE